LGYSDGFDIRKLHLVPTSFILDTEKQTELLKAIAPDRLLELSLSLFPFLVLDNLASGFSDHDPYEALFDAVADLHIKSVRLVTNLAGLVHSSRKLRNLESLEIDDQGFWDGGDPKTYECLAADRHRDLVDIIARSRLTTLTYRGRTVRYRPFDYAFFDFASVLRSSSDALVNIRTLIVINQNISVKDMETIFKACSNLLTLVYYPYVVHELPIMPPRLRTLRTNCSLPSNVEAIPPELEELCIRRDGPILPYPPDGFIPSLPALHTLHAYIPPQVQPGQIAALLQQMKGVRNLELLVLPLPWTDQPELSSISGVVLPSQDSTGDRYTPLRSTQQGWHAECDLARLILLLTPLTNLEVVYINHDHYLSTHPFPALKLLGPVRAGKSATEWWSTHKAHFNAEVKIMFDALPIDEVHWQICNEATEAWIKWHRGEQGVLIVDNYI
jgi:hypothetical protein